MLWSELPSRKRTSAHPIFPRFSASSTLLTLLAAFCFFFTTHSAAQPQLKENYPSTYTVVPGDTLWDISGLYLENPWMWPEIWHVNPQIENPHLIYPGDRLALVYVDGKPRLVINRSGEIKLSPQMRTSPLGSGIPAIPLEAISPFLSRSRVFEPEAMEPAPYIIAGPDRRLLTAAGEKIYGRGTLEGDGRMYGIYREGAVYKDPETREVLGVQAREIGSTRILRFPNEDDVFTAQINSSNEEIRVSDRLLPFADQDVGATFYPKAPDNDIEGVIIAVEGGVSSIGRYDVVTINRGRREGLQDGDVLLVLRAGERVKDTIERETVMLPDEEAGTLIVFKTFEKVAYGLILESTRPLSIYDKVINPS